MSVEILKQKGHRFLWIDEHLWMWDIPVERALQKEISDEAYGDVLIAGYGLGIVQNYLLQNPKVTSVRTVEQNGEVIIACQEDYGVINGKVSIGNFYTLDESLSFDCVIGDIWEDIVPAQLDEYKKFKAKAENLVKPDGKILAWGQDYFEYLIEQEGN